MSAPPPPPPHGEAPKSTAGTPPHSGLPPGNYDIFIIPPHSSGSGFIYLPSLTPNTNSFLAGYAACLLTFLVGWGLSPTVLPWWNIVKGQGGPGMILLLIAVGVGSWAGGRLFAEHGAGGANGTAGAGGGAGFTGGNTHGFGGNGGFGGAGPGASGAGPMPNGYPGGQHGYAGTPPPGTGPMPGAGAGGMPGAGPMPGSAGGGHRWQRGAPSGSTHSSEHTTNSDGGASESARASWERAREETKRKEEERKAREAERRAKEAEKKRKEEADEKLRQQREKETREREAREREAQARRVAEEAEREAKRKAAEAEIQRQKAEAEDQERRKKEAEALDKLRRERELAEKRLSEAREREVRERDLREKRRIEDEARAKRLAEASAREKKRREEDAAKKAAVEAARSKLGTDSEKRGSAYAFSSTGEKTNPWPQGRPKTPPPARPAPASSSPSPTKRPPPPTARTYRGTDDGYSYRPYDKPPTHARKNSFNSSYSHSSYSPSQSTSRTTPPPSSRSRAPYTTKDPNKIVLKAVYAFSNAFKGPRTQLVAGVGSVSDGLILKMTTEGLFIDDDVRGVPQREWDVKAWTMKLVEVWCPAFRASGSASALGDKKEKEKSSVRRLWGLDKEKPATSEETDRLVDSMLSLCKNNCLAHATSASARSSAFESDSAYGSTTGGDDTDRGVHQTGDRGKFHVLRASIRDDQGTKYVFVIDEAESWKVAVGLKKLRGGSMCRALGVSGMSANESKNVLDGLGWGL